MISAANIAHLLVFDRKNLPTLSIDLHVYSKNQQIRLYECVKYQLDNPLTLSDHYPFDVRNTYTHGDMIRKSMITNVSGLQIPIVKRKEDQTFEISSMVPKSNSNPGESTCVLPFKYPGSELVRLYSSERSKSSSVQHDQVLTSENDDWSPYISVINGLIHSDPVHAGFIQSIVRGKKNSSMLFFNISGDYRYCPKKGYHHQHNSIAFIVDVANDSYAIRCKDPSCDNSKLSWTTISR
jgi:hypothetical protein